LSPTNKLPSISVDSDAAETNRAMEEPSGKTELSSDPSHSLQTSASSQTEQAPNKEELLHGDQPPPAYTNGFIQFKQDQINEEHVYSDQLSSTQTKGDSYETGKEEQIPGDESPPVYANGSIQTEPSPSKDAPQSPEMSEKRIMKNVLVISIVFFLNFMAYSGMAMLQSSLHRDEGMGVITSAVGWASLALSCLLMPKIAIRLLGHKWCMSIAIIGYVLWMAANGYAVWATMIPANIIVGFSGAILWTTQGAYFAVAAKHYARKTGKDPKQVTSLFFGIIFAFFKTS